jgi:(S)-2-hydroxyglutarate dehydrogenase
VTAGADIDVAVIGAGIVGLATAVSLLREEPARTVAILEKESQIASHQSGRNSGVIHSGIYYRPGTAKADLVRRGRELLLARCRTEVIAHELCGKVIVASRDRELAPLAELEHRAVEHGIDTQSLTTAALRQREPHVTGIAALAVPSAGIVDFPAVCRSLLDEATSAGATLLSERRVERIDEDDQGLTIRTSSGPVRARQAVNCAGLFSDRVAASTGVAPSVRITPFRGEYHELRPAARGLVKDLVYPVPDPRFPFLGAHFTRTVAGEIHVGPNAVLALAREGYRWRDVDPRDVGEMLRDPGLRHLAARHWRTGSAEVWRSISTHALVRQLRRLVPEVGADDLVRVPSGVRAQALDASGALLDDFEFAQTRRIVHVLNAPSPAATASLAIGEEIAARVTRLAP